MRASSTAGWRMPDGGWLTGLLFSGLYSSVTGVVSSWTRHARCREFASAWLLLGRAGSYKLSHHALQDLICPSPRMLCKLTYVYARNADPLQPGTTTKATGGSLGKRCVIVPARFRAWIRLTFVARASQAAIIHPKGHGMGPRPRLRGRRHVFRNVYFVRRRL